MDSLMDSLMDALGTNEREFEHLSAGLLPLGNYIGMIVGKIAAAIFILCWYLILRVLFLLPLWLLYICIAIVYLIDRLSCAIYAISAIFTGVKNSLDDIAIILQPTFNVLARSLSLSIQLFEVTLAITFFAFLAYIIFGTSANTLYHLILRQWQGYNTNEASPIFAFWRQHCKLLLDKPHAVTTLPKLPFRRCSKQGCISVHQHLGVCTHVLEDYYTTAALGREELRNERNFWHTNGRKWNEIPERYREDVKAMADEITRVVLRVLDASKGETK